MAFLKVVSSLLLFASIARASLEAPPNFDKQPSLFGRRFVIVNLVPPPVQPEPQQQDIDYYDAVARGLDNQESEPKKTTVDGSTANEPVVSDPDYEPMPPVLKVSQKHLETKKLMNANPFNVQTPEEPLNVEPADTENVESSGQEPTLIDGDTGPPSIEPPTENLNKPPVAPRFTL
ncbi:hypothetical protein M3Y97_00542100 [Aphelenchoides bicaudatus]|nr:hypothetical protein M3Y97_00542100 [Aphelenchoides bicaudatus]